MGGRRGGGGGGFGGGGEWAGGGGGGTQQFVCITFFPKHCYSTLKWCRSLRTLHETQTFPSCSLLRLVLD